MREITAWVLVVSLHGCGGAPSASIVAVAAPHTGPAPAQLDAVPQLDAVRPTPELSTTELAQLAEALPNRRAVSTVAIAVGGGRVAFIVDRYDGPPWMEMVAFVPGEYHPSPVQPPPPGAPYEDLVARLVRFDETGAAVFFEHRSSSLRWRWKVFDLDGDGSEPELVVRLESRQRAVLWAAGLWLGNARARINLRMIGTQRTDAQGAAYLSRGDLEIVDGELTVDFERAVFIECSDVLDESGWASCRTRRERRRVRLECDAEGRFNPAPPFCSDGEGPFGPPPPQPNTAPELRGPARTG